MRRRLLIALTAVAAVGIGSVAIALPAGAWSHGTNRVKSTTEDGHAQTGMGPGWVLLSYKANGPMVGYLFGVGFRFADGSVVRSADRMDIRGTGDSAAGNASITRWPWGYAAGGFGGCAYAYGTRKFAKVGSGHLTGACAGGPRVVGSSHANGSPDGLRWWHSESVFCTASNVDSLCSRQGVWSTNKGGGLRVAHTLGTCPAWANIGAAAAYGAGTAAPRQLLGNVPPNSQVDIRYETKNRQWVMAKWHGHSLAGGTTWAFLPRGCVG